MNLSFIRNLLHGDFDPQTRTEFFNKAVKHLSNLQASTEYEERVDYFDRQEKVIEIYFGWNIPRGFWTAYSMVSDDEQKKLDQILAKKAAASKNFDTKFKEINKLIDWEGSKVRVHLHGDLERLIHNGLIRPKFPAMLKELLKKRVHFLQSHEQTKRINRIENSNEKRDAMRKHGDDLAAALEIYSKVAKLADKVR
jgi:hypothetical protein